MAQGDEAQRCHGAGWRWHSTVSPIAGPGVDPRGADGEAHF